MDEELMVMSEDDLAPVSDLIREIMEHPRWHRHQKMKRVQMLLWLVGNVDRGHDFYGAWCIRNLYATTLEEAVNSKYKTARDFLLWMRREGMLLNLSDMPGQRLDYLAWHVNHVREENSPR